MCFLSARRWQWYALALAAWILFSPPVPAALAAARFPVKPIKIIVYTGPGGAIDRTAREFSNVAQRYVDATFTVENKDGAGGIVAIGEVLARGADGYTLLACTKSNIAKLVATGHNVDGLAWLAMMISDPECVIARSDSPPETWAKLIADARARPGEQLWVGPATGGADHVMALKTWDAVGISAKWLPCKSGGAARAALLGGQAVAYVGNPSETIGNDRLRVLAVSGQQRLARFPNVPTFGELGIASLDNEVMWRGFAIRKETAPEILAWYDRLFRQVTADPQWQSMWQQNGMTTDYIPRDEFTAIVNQERHEFHHYLSHMELIHEVDESGILGVLRGPGPAVAALLLFGLTVWTMKQREAVSLPKVIPLGLATLCLLFLMTTFLLPRGAAGAATVPRLWIVVMIPLAITLFRQATRAPEKAATPTPAQLPHQNVYWFLGLLALYIPALVLLGYFASTFAFLCLAMYLLGSRNIVSVVGVAVLWGAISYLLFIRLLHVPLPPGRIF